MSTSKTTGNGTVDGSKILPGQGDVMKKEDSIKTTTNQNKEHLKFQLLIALLIVFTQEDLNFSLSCFIQEIKSCDGGDYHWRIQGGGGRRWRVPPQQDPILSFFAYVFAKKCLHWRLAPPMAWRPPPTENPGSATDYPPNTICEIVIMIQMFLHRG